MKSKLFQLVFTQNQSILVAAEELNIKYHTAKTMIARYRAEVRTKHTKLRIAKIGYVMSNKSNI